LKNPDKYKPKILLLLLVLILIFNNLLWYKSGHKPLHWDSSIHLGLSVDAYKTFTENILNSSLINKMLGVSWYYPPFTYYASIPFYSLFGINEFAGFIEINGFLILLLVSVYLIGTKLYNEDAGLFGAFCVSMYPIVIEYSRDYMLDLPLASVVALSVFLLLKTSNYQNLFYTMLAGVSLGCGMLVRWTFIFFLITPVIFFLIKGLKAKDKKLKVTSNFFLCIIICFIICMPWYLRNLIMIFSTRSGELGRTDLTFIESIFYYFKIIPGQISFVISVLLIIGVILFYHRQKLNLNYFLICWLFGSYIILTLIKIKAPRFSIALLIPFTLLLSGMIFNDTINQNRRKIFVSFFVITGLLQYIIVSFSGLSINYSLPFFDSPVISDLSPVKFENYNLSVLNLIEEDRIKNKRESSVLRVIPDEPNFNNSTLKYYAEIKNYPVDILGLSGFPLFTDYAVVWNGISETGNADSKRANLTKELLGDTSQLADIFKVFKKVSMKDGNELVIFKPSNAADTALSVDTLKSKIFASSENFLKKYLKPKNNFTFKISFEDTLSALSGNVKSLGIFSEEAEFGDFSFKETGLKINNFDIDIKDFDYAIQSLLKYNRLDILSMKGIEVNSLEINSSDLKDYIEKSTGNKIQIIDISFENNLITIEGHSSELNTDFHLELILTKTEDSNLTFKIMKCVIFHIPVPAFLLNYMTQNYNPLIKGIGFIKDFRLNKLEIKNNQIIIKKDI
jgi:4-amino-4-deoxy-L-arabinose transferase-like glycosyltransferase